ncbi:hypothetical protein FXO38_34815 [Capsicum annuum]|nr:hypothetical protein FXO38_34815 [Capsicum annuum]
MEFEHKIISDVDDKRERVEFKRVAQLNRRKGGAGGGWAVIGEDIYWVGGFTNDEVEKGGGIYACLDVFKHNCSTSGGWVKVSPRRIPRDSPFVGAVSGGKKICVVSGYERYLLKPTNDDQEASCNTRERWNPYNWSNAGEIYDPDTDSWTYLDAPVEPFRGYGARTATLALDKDEILFHKCRSHGSVVICNLGKQVYFSDLWSIEGASPPGLEGRYDHDIRSMFSKWSEPVLCDDTFY